MCLSLYKKYESVLDKIGHKFKGLQKICRVIALTDAIIGLIILIIFIIRRTRAADSETDLIRLLFNPALQILEILFALILFEGVRKRISWMVKIWLIYCLLRIIYLSAILAKGAYNGPKYKIFTIAFELTFIFIRITQAIFILALQNMEKVAENDNNITIAQDNSLPNEQFEEVQEVSVVHS